MSKKLDEYTKDELLAYVRELKKGRRFGLVWEPKDEQVVKDCETKLPILREVEARAISRVGDDSPTNILIEGDNFHSLTTLNYTHAGKIDVIYADPPYNTGARDWRYNNDFVDDTDAFRHSKWLSFMDNRLRIAKNLLAEDGIICVTIDDYEMPRLAMLLDDIFGVEHRLGTVVIRNNPQGRSTVKGFSINHEYALFYEKSNRATVGRLPRSDKQQERYPEVDEEGVSYLWENFRKTGSDSHRSDRPKQFYPLYIAGESIRLPEMQWDNETKSWLITGKPVGDEVMVWPVDSAGSERVWKWGHERVIANPGHLQVKRSGKRIEVNRRNYPSDGSLPNTLWDKPKYASGSHGTNLLTRMFGKSHVFDFPKSVYAVEDCLRVCSPKNDAIILDFFAGSGTTGHAVMEMNAKDGGKRQFILCTNNENDIAEEVTYERIRKVMDGYGLAAGIPANLRYFKTNFVDTQGLSKLTDKDKLDITKEMGAMIALKENSFEQVEQTSHWQTYENATQVTAIYYREDKTKIDKYIDKLNAQDKPVKLYVFGWGKNAGTEYASKKISVEDIPEPLIEVYKEIAK